MEPKAKPKRSWWRKRHVVLGLSLVAGLILVVFVQLLYPTGKALPIAHIGDSSIGGKTFPEVAETIRRDYGSVKLNINVPGKQPYITTTSEAGIVPNYRQAAEAMTTYSLPARLVPFSFVYKMWKTNPVGYDIDQDNFDAFYETFKPYCAVAPRDAALKFADGQVSIESAKNGQACEKQALLRAVQTAGLQRPAVTVNAPAQAQLPHRSDKDLQSQLQTARATVAAGLTIKSPRDSWQIPPEIITSWMTTTEVEGYTALDVKTDAIKTYLEALRGQVYVSPGVTKVMYLDGVEQSRTNGAQGQGIDVDVSAERIKAVLLGPPASERVAWMQLAILQPRTDETWNFSASEKGLQALLEQWNRSRGGNYGLMVRDLGGKGMNAEVNADKDFVTASTFKVFLAYAVLHKVETGELSLDSVTDMGLSVRTCIDDMILRSTNACALSLFNLAGWDYVHNFIRSQFPATSMNNAASRDNEKHTTPRDAINLIIKLQTGQLMNSEHTGYLLDLMKRQIWRYGIPKGVPGVAVADKVGFYGCFQHDIGIVYAARGPYGISFYSCGGTHAQIADFSRQVYALMSR